MAAVKLRAKRRGIPVRAGAVRQARFEAGLSLAAVAGSQLTRAAIHLIENGSVRPSPATLKLIAERTGKPISFFLEEVDLAARAWPTSNLGVRAVEELIERQEFAEAVEMGSQMLPQIDDKSDRARLQLMLGEAHLKLRQPDQALDAVDDARSIFEAVPDPWMVVECLDWKAYGLYMKHHPGAVDVAEDALARCRDLDPISPSIEARILAHLGNMHLQLHHWDSGLRYLEEALQASTVLHDLARMATINHDMATALASAGRTSEAIARAHRAINLYAALRDKAGMAALENDIGVIKMMLGDLSGAEGHLLTSLAYFSDAGIESKKSHAYLSLAELHMARGSYEQAVLACGDAAGLAERLGEQRNVATAHQYLGQIAARRGDATGTDAEFQTAIAILEENRATQRLVECRAAYADVLEERGDLSAANRQLRAALDGRSRQTPALRTASA
jgi:tetratricopeptide (TPR) repeat protein